LFPGLIPSMYHVLRTIVKIHPAGRLQYRAESGADSEANGGSEVVDTEGRQRRVAAAEGAADRRQPVGEGEGRRTATRWRAVDRRPGVARTDAETPPDEATGSEIYQGVVRNLASDEAC
jgi:hypothetical protein